jgi:NitT/TauT family transport system substrate-binding protein
MRTCFAALAFVLFGIGGAGAETNVKVGWCARTLSSAAAPYAVAQKLGWFAEGGIRPEVIPLPGSTDCVKEVATGDMPFSAPSSEPLAIIHTQGVKAKLFYTAYQGNVYGIAVPAASTVQTFKDLRGKRIGVISMASAGVVIARALAANAGFNPDTDIRIVVAGEGGQTAALLRSGQVDALSQFDTQYAMVEIAGQPLRMLDTHEIARFPSNGFLALEKTLAERRADAVALGRGYAKGTIFAMANPEAAIRILYEVYPQTKPTGKDEATAIADDIKTMLARARSWRLEAGGVKRWSENSMENYDAYLDFLTKFGVIKQKVPASELVTNDLIDEINKFDPAAVVAQAKAYKP